MNIRHIILGVVIIMIIIAISLLSTNKSNGEIKKEEIKIAATSSTQERIEAKSSKYPSAIELVNPQGYINTDNITLKELVGKKVILIDFWTYSCINCQRTLPHLTEWYDKYSDEGLEIIGVHTPEFEFEKDYDNVLRATQKWNVKYPVVQDNDYETWRAYGNRYWPRKYLIDIDGFIVYDHIGEGKYAETERKIQELLEERKNILKTDDEITTDISTDITAVGFEKEKTTEIYLGYERGISRNQMGNNEGWHKDEKTNFEEPQKTDLNKFYFVGNWEINAEKAIPRDETARIILDYRAKSVNLVAGSEEIADIKVVLDGEDINVIQVKDEDLYNLVDAKYSRHTIEITIPKGVEVYTFTFG
ncbi:MAG: redoxin domain-containing protein [Nanoarchaeota archaeon]|nr:redoxin domain-containing protein [Nanoarchaeota archaeon]